MKATAIAAVFAFVLALPGAMWAQDLPLENLAAAVSSPQTPTEDVVAEAPSTLSEADGVAFVKEGSKAPFAGLLVPEARFVELLQAELDARDLKARLKASERTAKLVEQVYLTKLEQAALVPWHESPSLNRWVGIFLGTSIAALSIWGAGELNK